jgi:hypothetical protein
VSKILVIEDQQTTGENFRELLEQKEYYVETAGYVLKVISCQ